MPDFRGHVLRPEKKLFCRFAMALASCQMFTPPDVQESGFQPSNKPITVDNVAANGKLAEMAKAQHPRILATYGGEYSDPKLERMVAKVV
ncbi:MAG: hypothetical protein E5V34_07080, partial [Mesorhizobium sp.]